MTRIIFMAVWTVLWVWMPLAATADDQSVCFGNAFALCSHAECTCVDDTGAPGPCEPYDTDTPNRGWAQCNCPVIPAGTTDPAYAANIGANACDAREGSVLANAFPGFVELPDDAELVASEYALGDALPGGDYGTLDAATMGFCPPSGASGTPAILALCLDMPCVDNGDGSATCYCQNTAAVTAPYVPWNSYLGACDQSRCESGWNRAWSGATVTVTVAATDTLLIAIREKLGAGSSFTNPVRYCGTP